MNIKLHQLQDTLYPKLSNPIGRKIKFFPSKLLSFNHEEIKLEKNRCFNNTLTIQTYNTLIYLIKQKFIVKFK